ncbi:uncharacterized protein LOC21406327 [Morus notabilis]|nr:uncharacterized protein LOC21406327 [Morus notabilis]
MALKETKSASSSIPTNNLASEKTDVSVTDNAVSAMEPGKEGDQERDLGRYNGIVNSSKDENMARGGNLTARKLFTEDLDIETEELPRDTNGGEELVKLRTYDLAGLSYVDSQEPGELSQANALDFVDRFIKENVAEFDKEIVRGSTAGNSKCVSSIKGPQKLAKKANEQSMIGELGIYDWDDSHEDEGGGDIFHRRKEDFFGGGSLGRRPLKTGVNGLHELKDGKKQVNGNDKRMDIFNSDTKLLLRNREVDKKVNEPEMKFRRNLINELDKQLEKNPTKADVPEMLDVGFDTQMAAEAMEALFYGEDAANCDVNDACHGVKKNSSSLEGPKQPSSRKRSCLNVVGNASGQSMKTRRVGAISNNVSSVSSEKQSKNVRKQKEVVLVTMKSENFRKWSQENIKKRKAGSLERGINYVDDCTATLSGGSSLNKQHTQEKIGSLEPIAHRTRRSVRNTNIGIRASARLSSKDAQLNKTKNTKPKLDERFEKMEAFTDRSKNDALSCPRRKRSCRNLSCQINKSDNINDRSEPSATPEAGRTSSEDKRSCGKTGLSIDGQHVLSSVDLDLEGKLPQKRLERVGFGNAQSVQTSARLDESPREKLRPFDSSCTTPFNCKVPVSEVSPVCMGDEYFNQSRRRSLSKFLVREIKFSISGPQSTSPPKDLRKRREITDVRVLYSNHLDEDVIKRQKKILARLGVSLASSIIEATHFIADQFVRTRNMLEAIASGKPVVTHLWIESCGEANCFIDEKNYILRDAKKEKEFGFSMPTSLSCASQNPLLQGFKVFVTQNTKPGKEIISSLVKAVRGRAVETTGRSALKDGSLPNDLLILSCEEDYEICVPFLEKGATIYSSELILNGIVTQKLEYGRYRLFTDNMRIIRSTMRLKKDGCKFLSLTKSKRD